MESSLEKFTERMFSSIEEARQREAEAKKQASKIPLNELAVLARHLPVAHQIDWREQFIRFGAHLIDPALDPWETVKRRLYDGLNDGRPTRLSIDTNSDGDLYSVYVSDIGMVHGPKSIDDAIEKLVQERTPTPASPPVADPDEEPTELEKLSDKVTDPAAVTA